jgi:hypothetical protein
MEERELASIESRVADKLIHNARWGLTTFPAAYRTQRDVALVNEIMRYCFSTVT